MVDYALRYGSALVLTIGVELGVARVLRPDAWRRLRLDVALVNLLSHPLLTLALRHLRVTLSLGEGLVIVLEALLYRHVSRLSSRRAWGLSLAANLLSWLAGAWLLPIR